MDARKNIDRLEHLPPAFVISLDFELHWGIRDVHSTSSEYAHNLLGARAAIPRMLDLFAEYDVAVTWATVGFLFAESRDELISCHPALRPAYRDLRFDPYSQVVGESESDDPYHYASSLIKEIASAPRQEVATHTYSHFYALEHGSDVEAFRHDIASAVGIAERRGIKLRSIVMPRNQWRPAFADVLRDAGIECYRGPQQGWMYTPTQTDKETGKAWRLARLIDAHVPLTDWGGSRWSDVADSSGMQNVGGTCFLRPIGGSRGWGVEQRLQRIKGGMTSAAGAGRIFHLWWHPHNFGSHTSENLAMLRGILEHFRTLKDLRGMESLSMIETAQLSQSSIVATDDR